MSIYLQILNALVTTARTRLRTDDRGVSTLEMVIIGLGLFLVATAVVAIITNAIMSRANQIN
jgi:hypothetical protein